MVFEVKRHRSRHRYVLGGLNYAAGHLDQAQYAPQVAVKDGSRYEQRYIGPHVEQSPAEFADGGWNVGAHR